MSTKRRRLRTAKYSINLSITKPLFNISAHNMLVIQDLVFINMDEKKILKTIYPH